MTPAERIMRYFPDQPPSDIDRLTSILRELGIPFYSSEDVRRYKAQKKKRLMTLWRGMTVLSALLATAIAVFCLLWIVGVGTAVDLTILPLAVAMAIAAYWCDYQTLDIGWQNTYVASYQDEIPHQATERMQALNRLPGNFSFSIQHFRLDPLLFVHLDSASVCIGAWDEPGLESKLHH
jgi:type IV secretory pathway TrbD component